jgi:ligand-binding sensor domain-containing protein/class 3 adenylate cyclase/predicted metal-dependent HD superfamily phosphohydrolase
MWRYLFILFLLGSHFSDHLFGQGNYRFRNYTISDGLSQSSVTSIVQDQENNLWIGTQDGLNRFDGHRFEVFTADNTVGLSNGYIKCSLRTNDGKLWFGTNQGLVRYTSGTETFQTYHPKGSKAMQVESMCEDREANIWLSTFQNGVLIFNPRTKSFSKPIGWNRKLNVSRIFCSMDGVMCLVGEDGAIYLQKQMSSNWKRIPFEKKTLGTFEVNNIRQFYKDYIWFATTNGVYVYAIKTGILKPSFTSIERTFGELSVTDLHYHDVGIWFISTKTKGLLTYVNGKQLLQHSSDALQKHALSVDAINQLFKDKSGHYWLATNNGISSFDPFNQVMFGFGRSMNIAHGLPSSGVWSFAEEKSSMDFFIGTDSGVSKFNRSLGSFQHYFLPDAAKKGTAVLSLFPLSKNRLLVGSVTGLFELTIRPNGTYSFEKVKTIPSNHQRMYSIVKWQDNMFWIGTNAGVLLVDLNKGKTQVFDHQQTDKKNSISPGICRLVFRDKRGKIWFSSGSGLLSQLDFSKGKPTIKPFQNNYQFQQVSRDYITSFTQTSANDYWFGTFGSGLLHWNKATNQIEKFTNKQGLPNNVVYGVLKDKSGNLWLSTNQGLCCYNPTTKRVQAFKESDGLLSNEFNTGAYFNSTSGDMFFGGIAGFNFFNPRVLTNQQYDLTVILSKLKLDKYWLKPNQPKSPLTKPLAITNQIQLTSRQRSFVVRFHPADISLAPYLNYKYELIGSDEGEVLIGNSNEIHFNSLSSGEYRLLIYARRGEGRWGKPTSLEIRIRPPFWMTWWFWSILGFIGLVLGRILWRYRIESERREQVKLELKIADRTRELRLQSEKIEKQNKQIEQEKNKVLQQQKLLQQEKDKTENLLKNVIPEMTADELKRKGKVNARAYRHVTVLFTDFVGFSKITEQMKPADLVNRLDMYFRKFDEIIVRNNLEKIKTIGDAYMCVGGAPLRNKSNPVDTVLAALQIQDFMLKLKNEAIANHTDYWELRLGVNTGPVTAGVIGRQRLAFDIWGSTVNHAQRMEMLGKPGSVTITGNTFDHIQPYFECSYKGKVKTKSRGLIDMYVVERIKPELSERGEGIVPNNRFTEIINLHLYSSINYYKAERHIMKLLEKGLSLSLHYHCIAHTRDVVRSAERIALLEGVTDEGLFLLKSAATYHDAGFIEQYDKNEPVGARLAEEILPKYGYSDAHIQQIKKLIFVTQIPHKPKNLLEEILCDADLDYLGRDDFHTIADALRRELKEHGKIDSDRKWDEIQVMFLESHQYFTQTAIQTRNEKKRQNLLEVKERLKRNEYPD